MWYTVGVLRERGFLSKGDRDAREFPEGVVVMEKFEPVVVNKGRKFRGAAYWIGAAEHTTSYQLPGWRGRGGWVTSVSVKLWSPDKGFVWCNPNYVEDVTDKPEEEVKADYAKYVDYTINSTIAWCRSRRTNPTEKEVLDFARNVIRKHHPEMLAEFNARNGEVDVVGVVESTINWALNLGYSTAKNIRIAFKALSKKGVMSSEAFIPALDITLTLRGLNKYMDKYLPAYIPDYKSVG